MGFHLKLKASQVILTRFIHVHTHLLFPFAISLIFRFILLNVAEAYVFLVAFFRMVKKAVQVKIQPAAFKIATELLVQKRKLR